MMLSKFSRVKTINISSLTDFKCCNNLNAYSAVKLVAVIVSLLLFYRQKKSCSSQRGKTLHMTFVANYYYQKFCFRAQPNCCSFVCVRFACVCICAASRYNGPFSKYLTALLSIIMNQFTCQ